MPAQTVLITGASSGFGRLLVPAFLDQGWVVLGTLRQGPQRAALFSEELARAPERFFPLALDVTHTAERAAVAACIESRCDGQLDCLVNNAGFGLWGALEDLSEEQIRQQMEVNFFGLAFLTRQLLPQLRKACGRVINISSVLGYTGVPLGALYCASKYAVEGLSESLRHELAPHGVQVAIVEPGRYKTRFSQNSVWGEHALAPSSPYRQQSDTVRRRQVAGAVAGPAPDPVIKAVLRLATARAMPLRVRCGYDARLVYALQRLLPARLCDALFAMVHRRLLAPTGPPANEEASPHGIR